MRRHSGLWGQTGQGSAAHGSRAQGPSATGRRRETPNGFSVYRARGAREQLDELVRALVRHEADGDVAHGEARDDGEARRAEAVCVVAVAAAAALVVADADVHNGERRGAPARAEQVPAGSGTQGSGLEAAARGSSMNAHGPRREPRAKGTASIETRWARVSRRQPPRSELAGQQMAAATRDTWIAQTASVGGSERQSSNAGRGSARAVC